VNTTSPLSTINERLCLALEGTGQIAFDWHIPIDALHFSGGLGEDFKDLMLDTSKVWSSRDLPSLIHEDDHAGFRTHLHQALKGMHDGNPDVYKTELRLKDGMLFWRWIEISGRIVERDQNGRAVRMVGTFSDINERKRNETATARLQNLYVALSQINQAIARLSNLDMLFAETSRVLVEQCGYETAHVRLLDEDIEPPSSLADINHATKTPGLSAALNTTSSARRVLAGLQNRTAETVTILPLREEERLLGALILSSAEKDAFAPPLMSLLEEITKDISFAIIRHERELQRQAIEAALMNSEQFKSPMPDTSGLKLEQTKATNNTLRYRQLLELSPEATLISRGGKVVILNSAASAMLGADEPEELLGKSLLDFIHAEYRTAFIERALSATEASPTAHAEQTWQRINGDSFPAEVGMAMMTHEGAPALQLTVRDITERKRAESLQLGQNRILKMVASGAPLPDILSELALFAEAQSGRALCSILQLDRETFQFAGGAAPNLPARYLASLREEKIGPCSGSSGTAVFRGEPVMVTDVGTHPLWTAQRALASRCGIKACTAWPIVGKDKQILGTFALHFRDALAPNEVELQLFGICTHLASIAIESRASEQKIRYLAHYDGLTALPNRFLFNEYLALALQNAQRNGNNFAVLFLDLDKFKQVNDTLGHDAGDMVLQEIARRMRSCLRNNDKIARRGGDEFYVLIEELSDGRHAAEVAQKLLDEARKPVMIDNKECSLGASIGISIYPDDGGDAHTLLKNADSAMYRAKEGGKNNYCFHSPMTQFGDKQRRPNRGQYPGLEYAKSGNVNGIAHRDSFRMISEAQAK
jgi:diguanylate cyclase (GGDEF)-like protein/PAS domain S-box-containing protein